jgi:hypothetical protein
MSIIIANCGCRVDSVDDTVDMRIRHWSCDAVDGLIPCVIYAAYCRGCANRAVDNILTDEEETAWLTQPLDG